MARSPSGHSEETHEVLSIRVVSFCQGKIGIMAVSATEDAEINQRGLSVSLCVK